MQKLLGPREVVSSTSSKKSTRCHSFNARYLELCRSKNRTPLQDIRGRKNAAPILDIFGDKLSVNDWLLIIEALYYDETLKTLAIKMRKSCSEVLERLDTERKAKLFKQKPVIFTKYIFASLVDGISNCIQFNKNLTILNLEGLPLTDAYMECVTKGLAANESIKEISFQRSNIRDEGCAAVCETVKYMMNVEKLNLTECGLTVKGAECVAEMIKTQKISHFAEGWQKSLRYRDFDPESISGLRSIILSRNQIGDDGLKAIMEVLKEDVWVKSLIMENCGFTDRGALIMLECLKMNNYIIDFNIRSNPGISTVFMRNIREHLSKDQKKNKNIVNDVSTNLKPTISQLNEQLESLREQLAFERVLRKKSEQLSEKLNQQVNAYENKIEEEATVNIPEGYVVVKEESLQSIIKERNDFQKIASTVRGRDGSPQHIPAQHAIPFSTHDNRTQIKTTPIVPPLSIPLSTPTPISKSYPAQLKERYKVPNVHKTKSEKKNLNSARKYRFKKKELSPDYEYLSDHDVSLMFRVQLINLLKYNF